MQVHAAALASELRRRRAGPRSMVSALQAVDRSTNVVGDLRDAPTSLLVLAALSLTTAAPPLADHRGPPPR